MTHYTPRLDCHLLSTEATTTAPLAINAKLVKVIVTEIATVLKALNATRDQTERRFQDLMDLDSYPITLISAMTLNGQDSMSPTTEEMAKDGTPAPESILVVSANESVIETVTARVSSNASKDNTERQYQE
jgi:hypothetical protein